MDYDQYNVDEIALALLWLTSLTRTDVSNDFGRNKPKASLDAAIAIAQQNGSLRIERREI